MQLHGFLSEKLPRKKRKGKKRVISEWTDTTEVFYPEVPCTTLRWLCITLINLLNIVTTNSFSWASNVTLLTTWCINELRRLELAQFQLMDCKMFLHCSQENLENSNYVNLKLFQKFSKRSKFVCEIRCRRSTICII